MYGYNRLKVYWIIGSRTCIWNRSLFAGVWTSFRKRAINSRVICSIHMREGMCVQRRDCCRSDLFFPRSDKFSKIRRILFFPKFDRKTKEALLCCLHSISALRNPLNHYAAVCVCSVSEKIRPCIKRTIDCQTFYLIFFENGNCLSHWYREHTAP